MISKIYKIKEEIAFRKADDGTLTIVSPVTDKIVTINAAAAQLWDLIDGERTVEKISEIFSEMHKDDLDFPGDEEALKDVIEIFGEFLEKEFIE